MDVVAVYAAVVSTASLVWQGWSYRQRKRPQARVALRLVYGNLAQGPIKPPTAIAGPLRYELEVLVMNVGEVTFEAQAVYPRSALSGGPSWTGVQLDKQTVTPDAPPSRAHIDVTRLPEEVFSDGVVAELVLVTGERFRSKVIFPDRDLAQRAAAAASR